ncbi:MAG TPA: hypothetical protein VE079_02075 [Ensifer sp.]|nr:hypothetical protein [Ensifer sp.]
MHTTKFSRMSAVALIIGSMVAAPAFAAGNGNGGGNGAGNGGGNAGGNSASHSSSDNAGGKSATPGTATTMDKAAMKHSDMDAGTSKGKSASKSGASDLGKLNGFLHASPEALQKAAPNSAIGLVTHGYANALNSYLAGGANAKTATDVYAALEKAANKPLTATTIAAVDAKLAKTDPTLAKAIAAHPGGAKGLAQEIAAAGPAKKATGTMAPAPKKTVQ